MERYTYKLSKKVRARVIHTLQQHNYRHWTASLPHDFEDMLQEVANNCLTKYGGLRVPHYEAARVSNDPVIEHFFACSDEEALQFIEFCFCSRKMGSSEGARTAVEAINRIFEEEGVGYEITKPVEIETEEPAHLFGRPLSGKTLRVEYPKVVKKGERTVHDVAVKPALGALGDTRLATANAELLKAFEKVRLGEYADAITSCGAAFESVLRTICDFKGWTYDPNKDTCASLVEICRSNSLFPPLYTEIFKGVGMVRNKMGDAHGKGPKPTHVATREHAEHMVAMTCTHITFLLAQAGF